MSTLVDAIINSDAFAATPSSARQDRQPTNLPSSGRAPGAASESNGLPSDGDIFPDDEVVGVVPGRNRNPLDRNVSKVVDRAGEKVQQAFEDFLESHIEEPSSSGVLPSSELKTDKYYINQIHGLREFQLSTLYVDYRHLLAYREGPTLADAIASQYYRFLPFMTQALHTLLAKYEPVYFRDHRQMTSASSQANTSLAGNATSEANSQGDKTINQQTDKIFTLAFYNLPLV